MRTPFRHDDPAGKRKALMWAAERDSIGSEDRKLMVREAWSLWALPWLEKHFAYNRSTLSRYKNAWSAWMEFLDLKEIRVPRELQYRHAGEYVTWRKQQRRRRGSLINHNTAVTEVKVMSRIMREAHQSGFCESNPFYQLGLKRENVRHAPEMTDDEVAEVEHHLPAYVAENPKARGWMPACFQIAKYHGVRLAETRVAMDEVHLDPRTRDGDNHDRITFTCKGRNGVAKIHAVPLHPELRPLMAELKRSGAKVTCEVPRMAAKEWWSFRRRYGLAHTTFHSTRTMVASKMARANVSIQKAKEYLAHASETIHLSYLRLNARDVADVSAAISYAKPSKRGTQGD